jgi:hypothetical protein
MILASLLVELRKFFIMNTRNCSDLDDKQQQQQQQAAADETAIFLSLEL